MRITRSQHQRDFVIIPNAALEDVRLSGKARGYLAYLLSRPDGWSGDSRSLAQVFPDGRDAILSGLRELEKARYLVRTRKRGAKGRWVTGQEIFDVPQPLEPSAEPSEPVNPQVAPWTGFPDPVEPDPVEPDPGEPDSSNKTGVQDVRTYGDGGDLELGEQAQQPRRGVPGRAARTPAPDVDEEALTAVIRALVPALQPNPHQRRGVEQVLAQRLAHYERDELIAAVAALPEPDNVVRNPAGYIAHAVPMVPERTTSTEDSPGWPPWCGECDEATRCYTDDAGFPEPWRKCDRCHPRSLGAFLGGP